MWCIHHWQLAVFQSPRSDPIDYWSFFFKFCLGCAAHLVCCRKHFHFLLLYVKQLLNQFSVKLLLPCCVTCQSWLSCCISQGFPQNQQMGNCVSSQSQAGVLEKQAAAIRGRNIVAIRKVNNYLYFPTWFHLSPIGFVTVDTCQCRFGLSIVVRKRRGLLGNPRNVLIIKGKKPSWLLRQLSTIVDIVDCR